MSKHLLTHYDDVVLTADTGQAPGIRAFVMVQATNEGVTAYVSLDAAEARNAAAVLMNLADEADERNGIDPHAADTGAPNG